ncbi:peptide-methionine (S)-S-oxide reductase MsrA [uncultured Traorella sp.]|uniref:peptide-methionine (S)-S-oxide reductase MsrA n=1 Tax=uncultured Traorella sp. TaxID=1929048 RepID=UPI0025CEBFE9|nr:peptide-methionine (S)-S-oxide reductase MsrA [uncultured Traorella sp.]
MKTIYLAGGCFWGIQKYMDQFDGIIETVVGYANGYLDDPTYEDVKAQKSGHAETVKIVYDEKIISLEEILKKFLLVIDPTSLNKQGEDEGSSYRSGIYYTDDKDSDIIVQMIQDEQKKYDRPIVVEILPLTVFYKAEEYHQKYLEKNPEGYCHIGTCFFKNKE